MTKAFISYSRDDIRKKEILENILRESPIEPIVVADIDQPSKYLAEKVVHSIYDADYLIPIITSNSMNAQWLNQEVGFSQCLFLKKEIQIVPLVQKDLIGELKGFINDQTDLPYSFKPNDNKMVENKAFKKSCDKLVKYLIKNASDLREREHSIAASINGGIAVNLINNSIELTANLTVENLSDKQIAIKEIKLTFDTQKITNEIYKNTEETFISTRYIKEHQYYELNSSPIIIREKGIESIRNIKFKSNSYFYENSTEIRNLFSGFFTNIRILTNHVNALANFILHNGKVIICNLDL